MPPRITVHVIILLYIERIVFKAIRAAKPKGGGILTLTTHFSLVTSDMITQSFSLSLSSWAPSPMAGGLWDVPR